MCRVIVVNEDGVAIRIVSARVPPIERTANHDGSKDDSKAPLEHTMG